MYMDVMVSPTNIMHFNGAVTKNRWKSNVMIPNVQTLIDKAYDEKITNF